MYMLTAKLTTDGLETTSLNESGAAGGIAGCSPPAAKSVRAEEGVILGPICVVAAVPVGVVTLAG